MINQALRRQLLREKKYYLTVVHDCVEELDKDHGRPERRRYWITEDLRTLPATQDWKGLRSICMVERDCLQGDTHSIERRYFINSIPAQAKPFAVVVRGHWGVEPPAAAPPPALALGCCSG